MKINPTLRKSGILMECGHRLMKDGMRHVVKNLNARAAPAGHRPAAHPIKWLHSSN